MNNLIQEIEEAILELDEDEDEEDMGLIGLLDDGIFACLPRLFPG